MKKLFMLALSMLLLVSVGGQSAYAMSSTGTPGADYTQDAEGFSQQFGDYMKQYLFGIDGDTRALFQAEVKSGYEDGTITMMTLMSAYANLRKASQVAEVSENQVSGVTPTVDVIKKYYLLTDKQKQEFESYLNASFSAINLKTVVEDGTITVNKGDTVFTTIKLVTEKPLSTTRIYMNGYIPAMTEAQKDTIEILVAEYAADGGSPAGSGALWRCIREIGQLMGVEATNSVDMQAGVVVVTVTKEGTKYLKDTSNEVQEQVVAKMIEGIEAIGCTYTYENGVFTVMKNGVSRLVHKMSFAAETETTEEEATAEAEVDNETETVVQTENQDNQAVDSAAKEVAKEDNNGQAKEVKISVPKTGENINYIPVILMLMASALLLIKKKATAK